MRFFTERFSRERVLSQGEISGEVEVLSAIPRVCPAGWCPERAHEFTYLVTPATKVTFLAKKYRFVFCLDLSASVATVVRA